MTFFCPPFLLIRADGLVDEFDDLFSLAVATRHRILISDHHITHSDFGQVFTNDWIVRDSFGQIVTSADVAAEMPFRHGGWWHKRHASARQAMERGLPIPRTGRRHRGHYFRRNRSIGYNRACAAAVVDTHDLPKRPTGKIAYMPDNYDDIPVSARDDRTWKRYRTTQWKSRK